jgi:RND superfamily putative drug exporter
VVRCLLVPAAMKLLGDWNWYLPRWLAWLPDFSVEGERPRPAPPAPSQPPRTREPV